MSAAAVIVREPRWHSPYARQHRPLFALCHGFWANILVKRSNGVWANKRGKHNNGGASGNHIARMKCTRESCTALDIFFKYEHILLNTSTVRQPRCCTMTRIRESCTTLKFYHTSTAQRPCCTNEMYPRILHDVQDFFRCEHRAATMLSHNEKYTRTLHYIPHLLVQSPYSNLFAVQWDVNENLVLPCSALSQRSAWYIFFWYDHRTAQQCYCTMTACEDLALRWRSLLCTTMYWRIS